jgi:hypothetical protein
MAITNGKHIISEIDGIRCTIVEDKANKDRVVFLKELLTFNKLEVKVMENVKKAEDEPSSFTVGVTDVVFNPVISIYEKKLYNKFGRVVTPNYWNQKVEDITVPYWTQDLQIIDIYRDECKWE